MFVFFVVELRRSAVCGVGLDLFDRCIGIERDCSVFFADQTALVDFREEDFIRLRASPAAVVYREAPFGCDCGTGIEFVCSILGQTCFGRSR